ncbi:MAG TPA: MarR family transcriptional regulator [Burkholderiaceae bacterium]|nr:MarR family transcriptional regulator [Burkholderiaceae bacterium]HMZ01206.1 MarR family transcriptional regulator [Burkholderiaceae bacterium]HNB46071.1 MarR family transcriptional regulator [Burkholderiaceae bacterium]HNG81736.1 MarR family transcriptional regulator [Burkholderiaceae bacterium]
MKSLRHLLAQRSAWMEAQLHSGADRDGYGYITPAMSRMFGQMGKEPVSLSELARRLIVSRQAVHQLANEALKHGLVELIESPTNRRVRLLRFTPQGEVMYASGTRDLRAIEARLAERIGAEDMAALLRILSKDWGD